MLRQALTDAALQSLGIGVEYHPVRTHTVVRPVSKLLCLALLTLTACRPIYTRPARNGPATAAIENKGSDTMVNLALAWAERYRELHPEVNLVVTGGGSGTGIAALLNNTVDIANASRAIKPEEEAAARANGVVPVEFTVARDAIAVVVHPSNPVDTLTLQQVSDIFSGKIQNWQEVGGEDRPIVRLSRETNSGTHIYFMGAVVRLGRADDRTLLSTDTLLLPSSEGISAEVRENPNTIGYEGLGYVTGDMKTVALGLTPEGPFWSPSIETVRSGDYPVAREMFMYTAGEPEGAIRDFIDWVLQPEAQAIVQALGFVPIEE